MERDFIVRPRSNNKKKIEKPTTVSKLPVVENDHLQGAQNIQNTEIIKKQIDAGRIEVASDLFSPDMLVNNVIMSTITEPLENFM